MENSREDGKKERKDVGWYNKRQVAVEQEGDEWMSNTNDAWSDMTLKNEREQSDTCISGDVNRKGFLDFWIGLQVKMQQHRIKIKLWLEPDFDKFASKLYWSSNLLFYIKTTDLAAKVK